MCVLVSLATAIYGVITEKKRAKRRWQNQISIEFREGLQGIAAALQAGYSMENALEESQKDLVLLYGEHSVLVPQMQRMSYELQLNQPIEEVFYRFGQLTQVEDVMRFAQVLHIAKRTGGDLIAITRMTADRISEKMEVKREILVMIAGKQINGGTDYETDAVSHYIVFLGVLSGIFRSVISLGRTPCYGSSFTCLSGSSILDRSHQSY